MIEEEEYLLAIQDLQKKFQKWFGNPVPADPPFPVESDHSIGDPVPPDLPLPAETDYLNHKSQRRHEDNFQVLLELLSFGFKGAVSLGASVGIIIFVLNFSFWGWHSNNWPTQIIVIFFATLLGFAGGLFKGFDYHQRERYFYKGEL